MKWTHNPPHITGWWFVGGRRRRGNFWYNLVEVRQSGRRLQWSFLDGLTWNTIDDYPAYWWAGPVIAPPPPKKT